MKKKLQFFVTLVLSVIGSMSVSAQVTISGGTTAAGSYTTLSSAIVALNGGGAITSPVTVDVVAGHVESLSAKIVMTATGDATNTITIQKSGSGANPKLTSYTGTVATPSSIADGFFALSGSDYVTIDGIDLEEKSSNTTTTTVMEYGYGLFKASATNGCQNNTIKNCTITLNRLQNTAWTAAGHNGSIGIIASNATLAATTALTVTDVNGSNSYNKFYKNTIQNCNAGIVVNGFAAAAPYVNSNGGFGDTGNDIGGSSNATGNTILNFGGGAATNPATGIFATSQWDLNVSYNTINNNNGSGVNHATTLRGVFFNSSSAAASATCNGNTITLTCAGTTTDLNFIEYAFGAFTTGYNNTATISGNTLTGSYLTATSGGMRGVFINGVAPVIVNIENNNISNWSYSAASLAGSGVVYPITQTTSNATSTFNIRGNTINNIARTGTTGAATGGIFLPTGVAGMKFNVRSNTVSNITIDGTGATSTMYGIYLPTGIIVADSNNINNIKCLKTSGTSLLYGLSSVLSPTDENYNYNTVHSIIHSGTGTTYGFIANTAAGIRKVSYNTVYNVQCAGTTVAGMFMALSSPTIFGNKIYNIGSSSTGAPTVSGLLLSSVSTGTTNGNTATATVYNNLIGDIKAPSATSTSQITPVVRGINLSSTTATSNFNLYHNTVYLNASTTGTNFATAGLFITGSSTATTSNVTLQNNLIVNNSTPASGTHAAVAYQRGVSALDNYNTASNNNLFYAGTASSKNLIYNDGTNSDQVMATFLTRMATRDQNSVTENVVAKFLSTTGSTNDFLHINTTIPTQIEGGGTTTTITTDIDGDARNSPPDIGADEFNGTVLQPPTISNLSISPNSTQCTTVAHPVTVEVTPGVSTTITDVKLNYAFNGIVQTPISMTLTSGSSSTTGTYTATIPVATPNNANVTWYVEAFAGALSKSTAGTPYKDELNFGVTATIEPNNNPICFGSNANLSLKVSRPGTANVGTGSTTSATYSNPFYSLYSNSHNQHLVLASELLAAGVGPGNISALGIDITAIGTLPMIDLAVKIAHTNATDMSAYVSPTFTTVYTSASYMPTAGINTLNFSTPFVWDGVSNIVIDICHDNQTSTSTMSRTCKADNTSFISTIHVNRTSTTGTSICPNTSTNVVTYSVRPQFYFTGNLVPPPTNYAWSTTETTPTISVSPTSNAAYSVTATVNNCPIVSSPFTLNVTPTPASITASSASTHCGTKIPTVSVSSNTGAATPTYKWYSAATGGTLLQTNVASTYLSPISVTTTFYVSELFNGCESNRVPVVANVTQPDAISFSATSPICAGTALSFNVTQTGTSNTYTYTWGATPSTGSGVSGTPTGSTQMFTPSVGNYTYSVTATDSGAGCITVHSKSVSVYPSITGTAEVATQSNTCPGVGTIAAYVNGAATVINNNFSSSVLPSNMTSAGNDFAITGGQMRITSAAASKNGGVIITNTTGLANNEFQIDFDLITTPGSASPADGFSYSYGPDVVALPTGTGSTTVNSIVAANTTNPENGSGTALKLAFDAFTNGANTPGIYLMYNCPRWNQSSSLTSADGLIYYSNNVSWRATATSGKNTHVTIRINNLGEVSMWLNNIQVVSNQPLPSDYLTADKSTWKHAFAGRTGAEFQGHFVDNLLIQYNGFYEYSLNGTTWTPTTPIQGNPGTYNVSARYTSVPSCSVNLGAVTIDPVNLIASATRMYICTGQSTNVSVTPNEFVNGNYQWQQRPVGSSVAFTDIAGANTSAYSLTLTSSSEIRCIVDCGSGTIFSSNILTITALDPQITSTTPNSRCGTGSVVLNAAATSGATITWSNAAGNILGTGTTFTTPIISTTTDFFVDASEGSTLATGGRLNTLTAGGALAGVPRGVIFTTTVPGTLETVGVLSTGVATTATIRVYNAGGTTQIGTDQIINIPANSGTATVPILYEAPISVQLPAAGTYRIFVTALSVTSPAPLYYEFSGVTGYPYAVGTNMSITSSVTSLTGTASLTTYYYFSKYMTKKPKSLS